MGSTGFCLSARPAASTTLAVLLVAVVRRSPHDVTPLQDLQRAALVESVVRTPSMSCSTGQLARHRSTVRTVVAAILGDDPPNWLNPHR